MKKYLFLFILVFAVISCKKNNFDVDVSNINVEMEIKRLDQDLFSLEVNADSVEKAIPALERKYGDFLYLYSSSYLNDFGMPGGMYFSDNVVQFISNYHFNQIYGKCQEVYSDPAWIEIGLENAFRHYKYYYPDAMVPEVIFCIIKTYQEVVLDSNQIGISIDKYLGREEPIYQKAGFKSFQVKNMYPAKMVSDVMEQWLLSDFHYNDSVDNLLSRMIYRGKMYYLLDAVLPGMHDTVKFGYTSDELEFCISNEKKMWITLVENKSLFETDNFEIKKFMDDGPFTPLFTSQSPARAVNWIGRQIVGEYMKKNKDKSLQDLMQENNYREILIQSKYNP